MTAIAKHFFDEWFHFVINLSSHVFVSPQITFREN